MIFDTHAHYDDEQFDTDRDELLSSMAAGGVLVNDINRGRSVSSRCGGQTAVCGTDGIPVWRSQCGGSSPPAQ